MAANNSVLECFFQARNGLASSNVVSSFYPWFFFFFFLPWISPLEKLFNLFFVPPLDLFPTSFSNISFSSLPSLQPLYCALFSKYVTLSNHHHGQVADVRHTSMHGASWEVSPTFYEMLSNSLIKTNK